MLEIRALEKSYATPQGPLPVLRGIDLDLGEGGSLALMGESGSGKSTLLHLAAGLDTPDGGHVRVGDATISALTDAGRAALRRTEIGLVFQQFNLVPSLDVAANVAFQARLARRDDPGFQAHLADRLGLSGLEGRMPEQLSGGQQQRVAIARALAARPRLVLADEPTGNLDQLTGDAVLALLLELGAETGAALLMATHSARIAAGCARTLTLEAGRLA
jgi:putative ABC transport system ATP-binding protein